MSADDHTPGPDASADDLLRSIPTDEEPPAELHGRVLAHLRERGLLDPHGTAGGSGAAAPSAAAGGGVAAAGSAARSPWRSWALAATAALVAFLVGRASAPVQPGGESAPAGVAGAPVPDDSWALLLYEDARYDAGDLSMDELVSLYGEWAEAAQDAGVLVLAEKLGESETVLFDGEVNTRPAGAADAPGILTGLFIVRAPSEEAALGLARETPHHRHGGSVLVRAIDPT